MNVHESPESFKYFIKTNSSMISTDDSHSPLIDSVTSNTTSIIKHIEPQNEVSPPSTKITIVPDSALSTSPVSPLKRSDEYHHRQIPSSRRVSFKPLSMAKISRQLNVRKVLHNRLSFLSDIMCFLGFFGIILMVIENEIMFHNINYRNINISWFIKLIITISTVILVSLIIFYHNLNLKLYATYNSLDHWRVGLTVKRIILIILEILICAIHPMPRHFPPNWISERKEINLNSSIFRSYIAIDVALGLPMFARLYLITRCIKFHSHLVRDAPSKSLGSFNQVSINLTFLMKTYLERWPACFLIISCCITFFIGSWSLRACDYKPIDVKHISILNSMWLFITTFTTVGYGDIIPSTYCGRTVVSVIALVGLLSSALLISVVTQKFKLTRYEKYVHNFVSDIELTRERRKQAANVIKFAIKVWLLKRKNNLRSLQYLKAQRLLYKSIHYLQKIKHDQRKLNDNCLGLAELSNIQNYTSIKTKRIAKEVTTIKFTINKIEEKIVDMNNTMNNIQYTLNLLLDKK